MKITKWIVSASVAAVMAMGVGTVAGLSRNVERTNAGEASNTVTVSYTDFTNNNGPHAQSTSSSTAGNVADGTNLVVIPDIVQMTTKTSGSTATRFWDSKDLRIYAGNTSHPGYATFSINIINSSTSSYALDTISFDTANSKIALDNDAAWSYDAANTKTFSCTGTDVKIANFKVTGTAKITKFVIGYHDNNAAPVAIESITLNAPQTYFDKDQTIQTSVAKNTGATEEMGTVNYSSSDNTVATVDANGLVKPAVPFKAGNVTITATRAANSAHTASVSLVLREKVSVADVVADVDGAIFNIEGTIVSITGSKKDNAMLKGVGVNDQIKVYTKYNEIPSTLLNRMVRITNAKRGTWSSAPQLQANVLNITDIGAGEELPAENLNTLPVSVTNANFGSDYVGKKVTGKVTVVDTAASVHNQNVCVEAVRSSGEAIKLQVRGLKAHVPFITAARAALGFEFEVTGFVSVFNGTAQIELSNLDQLTIVETAEMAAFKQALKFDSIAETVVGETADCAANWAAANAAYLALSDVDKALIECRESDAKYKARYNAWALANGGTSIGAPSAIVEVNHNNTIIIAVVVSVIALAGVCAAIVIAKKRRLNSSK